MDYTPESVEVTKSTTGEVVVTGMTQDQVEKAVNHFYYLKDYRKSYSRKKREKIEAMKNRLRELEAKVGKA